MNQPTNSGVGNPQLLINNGAPQMGAANPSAPPVIVIIPQVASATSMQPSSEDHFKKHFPRKSVLYLSIAHVVAGFLSCVIQIFAMIMGSYGFALVGQGIWCGIFYGFSGAFGIVSAKKPSYCTIITLMVLSILSACMSVPFLSLDMVGISISSGYRSSREAPWALYATMFVISIAAGVISIVLSALTCKATCCRKVRNGGTVVYNSPQTMQLSDLHPNIQAQISGFSNQTVTTPPPAYNETRIETQVGPTLNDANGDAKESEGNPTESHLNSKEYQRFF